MYPVFLGIVIIAGQFFAALILIFIAGRLIFSEAAHAEFTNRTSRFIRDLRPLQNVLVEFVGRSNEASRVLSLLFTHGKPLRLGAIGKLLRLGHENHRYDYAQPVGVTWAVVLRILQLAGLVGWTWYGFRITQGGREVHRRRIKGASVTGVEDFATRDAERPVMASAALTVAHRSANSTLPYIRENLNSEITRRCAAAIAPNPKAEPV